jgi:hypothetical protein
MCFIDLSVTLDNDQHWAPWWARTHVRHQHHRFGRLAIWLLFHLPPQGLAGPTTC